MICVGYANVKLKSGEERVLVSALARRSNTTGFDCQKIWMQPAEFLQCGLAVGKQFRAFSDGGAYVMDTDKVDVVELLKEVL